MVDVRAQSLRRGEDKVGQPLEELDTPAALVDLDILERNVARMQDYADLHGIALSPHAKTHKSARIGGMQIAAGAAGLTVARLGEAEVFAAAGVGSILVHYPVVGHDKLERLAALAAETKITVALDSIAVAEPLAAALARAGVEIDTLIEIDVGMGRTGCTGVEEARRVARAVDGLPALRLAGLSFFPGHLGCDRDGVLAAGALAAETREALLADGLACDRVSGGSTPSRYLWHETCLTELRCGSYVFLDRSEAALSDPPETLDSCALSVLTTVVSAGRGGRVVVDAGSKTLSNDPFRGSGSGGGFGAVLGHPDAEVARLSEEHGVLDWTRAAQPVGVGNRLRIVPNHACASVNLFDFLYAVRDGVVCEILPVDARGPV
ncbi:MAG: alanine racemase [Gaiellaceae bacterium]